MLWRKPLLFIAPFLFMLAAAGGGCHETFGDVGGAAPACPDGIDLDHATLPPANKEAPPPAGSGHATFAISSLFVGDTSRSGLPDKNGWKHLGFDLDGKTSGSCGADGLLGLCIPAGGLEPESSQTDGDHGIDNAFGRGFLPILTFLDSDYGTTVNADLAAGGPTVLIEIDSLGSAKSYTGVTARLYAGAPLGKKPVYDGTDAWTVRPESLKQTADPESAILTTSDTYLADDAWVGRFYGDLTIELPWRMGPRLHLRITNPVVAMKLDPMHVSAQNGTLAGVISVSHLVSQIQDAALWIDSSLCPSSATMQSLAAQLEDDADILKDGTQNTSATCDGLSVGLGFDAKQVTRSGVAAPETIPPPPACTAPGASDADAGG